MVVKIRFYSAQREVRATGKQSSSPSLHSKPVDQPRQPVKMQAVQEKGRPALKAMLTWIFAYFFGCTHRHTTWPHHHASGFDYVCCLDCGAELPYSVGEMRLATSGPGSVQS